MVLRRPVTLVIISLFCLAGGISPAHSRQSPQVPLILAGHVSMTTSPDGRTTVVSIDVPTPDGFPDGLVDHAFRLQRKAAQALTFDGRATLTYTGTGLAIEVDGTLRWVFAVERTPTASDREPADPLFTVFGLSHHWGGTIHESAATVTGLLLSTGCSALLGDPSCATCQAGGSGAEGCAVDCDGGSGCSASCSADAFACCNCPGGCRCCPVKEGG